MLSSILPFAFFMYLRHLYFIQSIHMLLIYIPAITQRSEYVFDLIFKDELGIEYRFTTDSKIFEEYELEKINYSSARFREEFFIKSSSLLYEKSISKINIPVDKKHDITVLFPDHSSCDLGFDIFAAVFFMVSRYEEYLPFTPDTHGRFKAADSFAYKNNLLQYPVVNIWINYFKNVLQQKFPALQFKTQSFKAIVTYDIDIAYKFRGRSILRLAGATVKDSFTLKFKNILHRVQALSTKKDPWGTYDYLKDIIKRNNLNSVFFFLLGDYSQHDKNINYDYPLMSEVINMVSEFSEIGIHPSYKSLEFPEKISIEKKRLEKIVDKPINKSRQHFLRFKLPDTYTQLLNAGIAEDYSMGFADMAGFRAGTCSPFYFYDLANEKPTDLKIFPTTFMDANFLYYSKITPQESIETIFALLNEVKKVNGTFISIWHNNTVSEDDNFKDWRKVHEEMIRRIIEAS